MSPMGAIEEAINATGRFRSRYWRASQPVLARERYTQLKSVS